VSANKAKFLARQETSLMTTKLKETRYREAGVNEYKWKTVAGSKLHPVRPSHKILEGRIFRWDDPPITTPPGEAVRRNNPGQDYNCRCFAQPIVRFKT
jgi:SPP1 gp7 family putative phage head morphogenesis protein